MLTNSTSFTKNSSKDSFFTKSKTPKNIELDTSDRVVFGLCKYQDIDNYFNELCQESKTQPTGVQKVVNYVRSHPPVKSRVSMVPVTKNSTSDLILSVSPSDMPNRSTLTSI